ncbi:ABC transporter ATP-binding protein [Streptomyces griseus]|uniref:ABC-type xenobiotic transporter n=1 Tax=Streptomyces sp. CMC78 TaxID=3231512 RepID=A0AB33KJ04_9ACTN|nr:ABC transporter ATP-binding protein [Streptomyces sp. ID01-9D]MDX5573519.1 ABC transporter ATP-binding protein [Streptomyces sp. ID01-9D]WSV20989.1 ABC transporter ATP-binding protein [Streptomyces fimicarius]WTC90128.1 ABC transporter ATP-binding protein [Streptomyces griseus]WTD67243.1 ABC transporter ATP-binding protein [Streptomyces griseus]
MTALDVRHLHKRYGHHVAVDDVSFTVEEGEIFGIIGPNGAGKTTTVESIAGLRTPDSGSISVLGLDPVKDRAEVRERLGVQLQESGFPDAIKVAEALDLYSSFYRDPADWRELMELLDLTEKRNTRYKALSGGQKQRLSIALALVGNPQAAILDELTTGLDPQARRDTWSIVERVRDTGVTILLVTHFMDEAERLCDRIAVIDAGRVAAVDTPAGLIAQAGAVQQIRFRVGQPLDRSVLAELPEVTEVEVTEDRWLVTGRGQLLGTVAGALARAQVVAEDLRVDQRNLDDAFVAFTGRAPGAPKSPGASERKAG